MKTRQAFRYLLWTVISCALYVVTASEEDLVDFDFADLKEIDWNYDNENASNEMHKIAEPKLQPNVLEFDDYDEENQVRPFDWRENVLKNALAKALTNGALRQKFVEVMPILRVLSSQQRLALSALISAQINAKKGQELKLEQVRMMFGDDKKLLLPIVYDIANLVRNSARRYLKFDVQLPAYTAKLQKQQTPIVRRNDDLSSVELDGDEKNVGTIVMPAAATTTTTTTTTDVASADSSLEDFFGDMPEDVLDPLSINQELQSGATKLTMPTLATLLTKPTTKSVETTNTQNDTNAAATVAAKRTRRSAAAPTEFVHKLLRSVPVPSSEGELRHNNIQLNTTAFVGPKEVEPFATASTTAATTTATPPAMASSSAPASTQSYEEIENLAFAGLNGTELDLTANAATLNEAAEEPLPSPEELIAGPRYRVNGNKIHALRSKPAASKRKRVQLGGRGRPKGPARNAYAGGSSGPGVAVPKKCERFTASMCIRTDDYPLDQIMGSIRRHKNAMTALLAEYHDKAYDKFQNLDFSDDLDDFSYNRREDDATAGGMCQSVVRYARPQKARSASGEWKYIVNTGQHTQTLRLEKCTKPQESCSYLAHNYRSHCAQVYNYHRLLSWDKTRGLHVDIFKVPTCCSCQVDGYRQQFPPLSSIKSKDYSPGYNVDTYGAAHDDLDYNDDEDDDVDLRYQLNSNFAHQKLIADAAGYDDNELLLGSKPAHTKVHAPPNPTLGSYLSPPGSDEYEKNYAYVNKHQHQSHQSGPGKNLIRDLAHRRPAYKRVNGAGVYNEARADMDLAPSESRPDKEVNFAGNSRATPNKRVPQKRQRIHSVPHTATVSTVTTAATVPVTVAASAATRRGIVASRGGPATNAHQAAPPARVSHYDNDNNNNNDAAVAVNVLGASAGAGGQPKSRFHAPAATTLAAPSATESTRRRPAYQQPTPARPSLPRYHVNSIYSAKYPSNATAVSGGGGVNTASGISPKRINYSYHPIIDFFESNKYSTPADVSAPVEPSDSGGGELLSHKIPKATSFDVYHTRERRIGFGAGGGGGGGGGGVVVGAGVVAEIANGGATAGPGGFQVEDNSWHPVIVETEVRPYALPRAD